MMRLETVSVPLVRPEAPPEVMVDPSLSVTAPAVPVPEREPLLTIAPAVPKSWTEPPLVTAFTEAPEATERPAPEPTVTVELVMPFPAGMAS